jgi:CBS domain-containing protein
MVSTAADVMTSTVISVLPTATIAEIAALLSERHISAAPVCDREGKLLGLVSEGDLLRPFRESAKLRRDWWLGLLASGEELSDQFLDYIRLDTRTAADVMVRHVVTAEENATLPHLAELMIQHGIKRIPILRNGRVIGIVSRADLVAAIARAPALLN